MGQVFPFRNVREPHTETPCELCNTVIKPGKGYAVLYKGSVDGYVCEDCFVESQPCDSQFNVNRSLMSFTN